MMPNVAVVVPTCRGFNIPKQSIPVEWIIVHDKKLQEVEGDAMHIVAPEREFYGRGCDSIRSAGFLHAYKNGADYLLTVDDDCHIPPDWAEKHVEALSQELHPWWSTIEHARTRGMPYEQPPSKVAISHGVWDGVPDLDARTQQKLPHLRIVNYGRWQRIGAPFAQSSMNLGFRREVTPVMYQPNQGEGTPFDRFADIWGGMLAQYSLTKHNYAFLNGGAVVTHDRASNVEVNLVKEAPGAAVHEDFYKYIWTWYIKGSTLTKTYAQLAKHVGGYLATNDTEALYFERLSVNMLRWLQELGENI